MTSRYQLLRRTRRSRRIVRLCLILDLCCGKAWRLGVWAFRELGASFVVNTASTTVECHSTIAEDCLIKRYQLQSRFRTRRPVLRVFGAHMSLQLRAISKSHCRYQSMYGGFIVRLLNHLKIVNLASQSGTFQSDIRKGLLV